MIQRVPLVNGARGKMAYALMLNVKEGDLNLCRNELQKLAPALARVSRQFVVYQEGVDALAEFWDDTMPENVRRVDPKVEGRICDGCLVTDGETYRVGWDQLYATLPTSRQEIPPTEACVLRTLACLRRNADLPEIVLSLKSDPALQLKLFRYLTTARFAVLRQCRTFEQLVMHVGYRELEKWVSAFLLWSSMVSMMPDLHRTALVRARQLEVFAQIEGLPKADVDTSFIIGILSMMPALLSVTKECLVQAFSFGDTIVQTLQLEQGPIAKYLAFVEASERGTESEMRSRLAQMKVSTTEANLAMVQGLRFADDPYRD